MRWNVACALVWCFVASTAVLASGCGSHTGQPYNADRVAQLAVGQTTLSAARTTMGEPFKAFPVPAAFKPGTSCGSAEETWIYSYSAKDKSSCRTVLVFDASGKLCDVANEPAIGKKCHGED